MSIPLYFAYLPDDSVNNLHPPAAQCGFGFFPDGAARLPKEPLPSALAVIDDAVLPKRLPQEALATLAAYCRSGCMFDFEHNAQQIHAEILLGLSAMLSEAPLFAAPERFLKFCPHLTPIVTQPKRCDHWRDFVRRAHVRFPKGWMLELQLCESAVRMPFSSAQRGYLKSAVCCYRQEDTLIRYYDTAQTLRRKLEIAEQYGCISAIGLYSELAPLFVGEKN